MAMRSGFFDSDIIGYDPEGFPIFDRAEDAEFYSRFWGSLVGNGVLMNPSDCLKVLSYNGMRLAVQPGICWIEGRFAFDDGVQYLAIDTAHGLYNRIDRVVLRMDLQSRDITVQVKKGTPATNPQAPELTRPKPGESADIYELGIADVLITKASTTITQDKITDLRMSSKYCGYVSGLIKQADTEKLFEQCEAYLKSNMAEWESRKAQQKADWQKQMTTQQSDFDKRQAIIQVWFDEIQGDISKLQTFDIDNLFAFVGCTKQSRRTANGFTYTLKYTTSGRKVATLQSGRVPNGHAHTLTIYDENGVGIKKRVRKTTVRVNGGYDTKIEEVN